MSAEASLRRGPTLRAVGGAVVCTAIMVMAAIAAVVASVVLVPTRGALAARRFVMDVIVARLAALSLWVLGVRVELVVDDGVDGGGEAPWRRHPDHQFVYVFNHTSSLDIYVVSVLGLPRVRTFFKRRFLLLVPMGVLGVLSGTFLTMPQTQPAARTRLFQRATRGLTASGESVFLSPEGTRVTTGEIGHFNKGAFHLAAALQAPIVPLFFETPDDVDPGKGIFAGQGVVRVHVLPTVDTHGWCDDTSGAAIAAHADAVRAAFVEKNAAIRAARRVAG